MTENPKKSQAPLMSRFVMFSAILFLVILVAGSISFMFSMRQLVRINKGSELSQLLEIKRLRLETSVYNEISIALMIAGSPLIRSFFADPSNPQLRRIAFEELTAYRNAFAANSIFWVNNIDKLFYFNDEKPFVIAPELPENYWYNMTLFETEEYNFNINYNPDLNVTNLWINVPVFDYKGNPIGIIGTGIDLTTFLDMLYENKTGNVEIYLFNSVGEITGARDVGLVSEKRCVNEELDFINVDIISIAKILEANEMLVLDFPAGKTVIGSIPLLEWYSIAVFYYSMGDYKSAMTVFFFLTLIVIVFVLIIFNMFIYRLLIPMRRSMEEAEIANKAKSAFLSTMSHEIRTPMNAILGITEIQLQNNVIEQSVREGLEKIYASGDMLLGIINDILDLSKIEAGKLELLASKYETASLISDTAQLNMMRIGSKSIEFELNIDENLPTDLLGDELRVKQILNNILSNAFKYTEEGTVTMSVSSKVTEGNDDEVTLIVSIRDTGQGMTKEQVDMLFDEYSRFNLEANRSTEGTGLGMSITRSLIHMMNGEIVVESEPGKGSVFTVFMQQGMVNSNILGKEMVDNLHNFRTSSRSQMKRIQIMRDPMPYGSVLIVDDVETNIFVARGLLTPYLLNIDSTDSGFGAIEKIRNGSEYDIVFMDHMMPKMDGIEATKRLREMGYKYPIVALTANAVAGQADIFLGNGFDDFISKPIDIRQLNSVLNKLIRDKQPPEIVEEARRNAQNESFDALQIVVDPKLAEIFIRDANKSLTALETFIEKGGPYNEKEVRTFVIHTHGIKSALANIGMMELSAIALKLEQLGRDNNIEAITVETPAFIDLLRDCVNKLKPQDEQSAAQMVDEDTSYLTEKLLAIKAACDKYDDSIIEEALTELRQKVWSQQTRNLLETISEKLLHSDFNEIEDIISSFMEV